MSSISRVVLLPCLLVLVVGSATAKDWTLANGKTVTGEFKSSKNAVVYLDNGNKLPFHRLRERDQTEIRRKLVLKNAKDALAAIKRPERPTRSFLHANGSRRMKGRMLGVTSSGDVLIEVGFDVYEFALSQFSAGDAKYIRSEAKKVGDEDYLPKEEPAGSVGAAGAGEGQNRLGGGPMTGAAGGGGGAGGAIEKGDLEDSIGSMPPSPDHGMERRSEEFDIRQYPNYPGGANNPFEQGPPQSNEIPGLSKPGGFAPRPGTGPAVSGGAGAASGDFAPKTNNLQGLDGVEFGREELPPIVIKPGDPGYEELKAEEDAKRRANQIFPMDEAPAEGRRAPEVTPFGGVDQADANPSEETPFSGGDAMHEEPATTDEASAESAEGSVGGNSLAIGVLIGAGGMMLLLGGIGVGLLIGKNK